MVPLAVVDPEDFGEGFGLNDNVVTDDELDGNGFDKLNNAWIKVGLKEGNSVSFAKPLSSELVP